MALSDFVDGPVLETLLRSDREQLDLFYLLAKSWLLEEDAYVWISEQPNDAKKPLLPLFVNAKVAAWFNYSEQDWLNGDVPFHQLVHAKDAMNVQSVVAAKQNSLYYARIKKHHSDDDSTAKLFAVKAVTINVAAGNENKQIRIALAWRL